MSTYIEIELEREPARVLPTRLQGAHKVASVGYLRATVRGTKCLEDSMDLRLVRGIGICPRGTVPTVRYWAIAAPGKSGGSRARGPEVGSE